MDARDLHYHALNRALSQVADYTISREDHLSTFDGLPTRKKLDILVERGAICDDERDDVWRRKQELTEDVIYDTIGYQDNVGNTLDRLADDYLIYVASNSIRNTVKHMLIAAGLIDHVDFWVSNEDVVNPKPNAEMYLRCMITAGVNPDECVIVEDSHIGRQAAQSTGARLCAVTDPDDLSYEKVMAVIEGSEEPKMPKWQGNDMNILIPMAGAGKRFEAAGYSFPKPLIDVRGKPMIQVVVENLNIDGQYIFVVRKEHRQKYALDAMLNLIAPGCKIVETDGITEGAACTTLLARDLIDNDKPLLIANSDQYVEWNSNEFMYSMVGDGVDGGIATFKSTHPKWSYARLGDGGFVVQVAEKEPISDNATVGIYYWKRGSDYVNAADWMISTDKRVNNEFYVCPTYNEAVAEGCKIKIFPVKRMWGLGTPEDLREFLEHGHTN